MLYSQILRLKISLGDVKIDPKQATKPLEPQKVLKEVSGAPSKPKKSYTALL